MIAVVNANGTSFKGLMNYLLTGKNGNEADRVDWTHTENLGTDNPRHATAMMIATAKMQNELKREAGIRNTGRKSPEVVQHITLSWAEGEEVSKDEMLAAARGALTYLGVHEGEKLNKKQVAKRTQYADQHQVVMVAHKDKQHRHVHLCINRVHGDHGVMLPENKNFNKLSAWALDYRRAMGREDLCPQRAINAAKRAAGLLTNHPRVPRNVYELEKERLDADPGSRKRALLEEQQRRGKQLRRKTEQMKADQAQELGRLQDDYKAAARTERAKTAEDIRKAQVEIKNQYSTKIEDLKTRQAKDLQRFEKAQETLAGRVRNTWSVLKTKAWMTEIRSSPLKATSQAFGLAFSSGLQKAQLEKFHAQEQKKLTAEMRKEERVAAKSERAKLAERIEDRGQRYTLDRADLVLAQTMDRAKLAAEWKQLNHERRIVRSEDAQALDNRHGGGGGGKRSKDNAANQPSDPIQTMTTSGAVDPGPPPVKKPFEKTEKSADRSSGDSVAADLARKLHERNQQQARDRDEGMER